MVKPRFGSSSSSDDPDAANCCQCTAKFCLWFSPVVAGAVVTFGVLAFVAGMWAFYTAQFTTTFTRYTATAPMSSTPSSHVIVADSLVTVTLPNNLVEFVGKTYNVDCGSNFMHVWKLGPGLPQTTWNGADTIAKCGGAGAGMTFHVVGQNYLRIISSTGMVFL